MFDNRYNVKWQGTSKDSSDSMPVGGHDIGCNVWSEGNSVYLYIQQSGWFDENNSLLKFGRIHLEFEEGVIDESITQELMLDNGYVLIMIKDVEIQVWVDVHMPVVHIEYQSETEYDFKVSYESWRTKERTIASDSFEVFQCKEVYTCPDKEITFHEDTILPSGDSVICYHNNQTDDLSIYTEFDAQGIGHYKEQAYNPQRNLISGGILQVQGMSYVGQKNGRYQDTEHTAFIFIPKSPICSTHIQVVLHCEQSESVDAWIVKLKALQEQSNQNVMKRKLNARKWWRNYFAKSYIEINNKEEEQLQDDMWKVGRNYQLFRYMLGCNYYGFWPTKFNGGLFTFDPGLIEKTEWWNDTLKYTPDYRLHGSGSYIIQNQRLLYWPMLKSGDAKMMKSQFDLFNRALDTAKMRTRFHFGIEGAIYPEQLGTYGLCNTHDHGWDNQTGLPVPQIKYHFSNNLEIALMILEYYEYTGNDISEYMEFIKSILDFYNNFYPENDEDGKMIIYPGNALETYHMVKNPIDGVAGLICLLNRLLVLPEKYASKEQKSKWEKLLDRVPLIKTRMSADGEIIAYADNESEIFNCEMPEMYTVFPYDIFGIGKENIDLAKRTIRNTFHTEEMASYVSWHYAGIEYARLGMQSESLDFLKKKMADGPHRFPAFWGPGHDWTPDHNWGGAGEIQLQEMLMQTRGNKIYLLPCWSLTNDVQFKLHAPHNTTVSCSLKNGKIEYLEVSPVWRKEDIIIANL